MTVNEPFTMPEIVAPLEIGPAKPGIDDPELGSGEEHEGGGGGVETEP